VGFIVAIDGPAASGKSTVARHLAQVLGARCLSTGEMYRAVAWKALDEGIDPVREPETVRRLLTAMTLDFGMSDTRPDLVLLVNGRPVPSDRLRARDVTRAASIVAKDPVVREWLVERQRSAARFGDLVVEGRDIGTVVFPDAPWKFFLTATPEVRARRRLVQEGQAVTPEAVAKIAAEIAERDRRDSTRSVAPLRPAPDAYVIDTSDLSVEDVVREIVHHLRRPSK